MEISYQLEFLQNKVEKNKRTYKSYKKYCYQPKKFCIHKASLEKVEGILQEKYMRDVQLTKINAGKQEV